MTPRIYILLGILNGEATNVEKNANVRWQRVNKADIDLFNEMRTEACRIAEVVAAAHASLNARDLADQVAADDRLRAALAAYEPEAPHEPV